MNLSDNQVINLDENIVVTYFADFISLGLDISNSAKTIIFKYDTISKKYVDYLINQFYNDKDVSIVFRANDKTVGFTTKDSIEQLCFNLSKKLDDVRYSIGSIVEVDGEIKSIVELFNDASTKNASLAIGVKNTYHGREYKLMTDSNVISEVLKKPGLMVHSYPTSSYKSNYVSTFTSSSVDDPSLVFNTIKNNLNVYTYQMTYHQGFISNINIVFLLVIDIVSIAMGLYFLLH